MAFEYDLSLTRTPAIDLTSKDLALRVCVQHCKGLEPTLVAARLSTLEGVPEQHYLILQATADLVSLRVNISDADSGEVLLDEEYLEDRTMYAWSAPRLDMQLFAEQSRELVITAFGKGFERSAPDSVTARLLMR